MQSNQVREETHSRHLLLKTLNLSQVQACLNAQPLSFLSLLQKSMDLKHFKFFQHFHLFLPLIILVLSEILKFIHVILQEFVNKELSSFVEAYLTPIFVDLNLFKKGEKAFLYLKECQIFRPKFYLYTYCYLLYEYFHGKFHCQLQIIRFKFKILLCFTFDLLQF